MRFTREQLVLAGMTLGATALVVAALGLVKMPKAGAGVSPRDGIKAQVGLATLQKEPDGSSGAHSELLLQDPTPLFLPTEFNSGRVEASMTTERSPGASFGSIPSKLLFSDTNIALALPEVVAIPVDGLSVVTRLGTSVELSELGRKDVSGQKLPFRRGVIQVLSMATGSKLWSGEIPVDAMEFNFEAPWEFILAINGAGSLSFPTVVNAGEGALVDLSEIADVLKAKRLGAQLRPGIYRILLGP